MSLLDFGKLNAAGSAKQTDPRKIFTTLKRDARFKRPLDEQADVLDGWYSRRAFHCHDGSILGVAGEARRCPPAAACATAIG